VVAALFRASKQPQNDKIAELLSQDFSQDRWKLAAAKNAFALLAKQRYEDAVAFFLLAGKVSDAARVCVKNLKDLQLGLVLARVVEGETSPALADIVAHSLVMHARAARDVWLASIAALLAKDAPGSVQVFAPGALPRLESGELQACFAEAAAEEWPLPTRYDPAEAAFLRARLALAPFWGKAGEFQGLVREAEAKAARFFLGQGAAGGRGLG
jgi:hypothetical protein